MHGRVAVLTAYGGDFEVLIWLTRAGVRGSGLRISRAALSMAD